MRAWVRAWLGVGLSFCVAGAAVAEDKSAPPQSAVELDWAAAARMDIEAIHDTLRDNHPGPVDVGNPAFAEWLKEGIFC